MRGVGAPDGRGLRGLDHLRQSVRDILTTPVGSRVMRREYGSRLFDLVDRPLGPALNAAAVAATAEALRRWEPRLRLGRVAVSEATAGGRFSIALEGEYVPDGTAVRLDGIEV